MNKKFIIALIVVVLGVSVWRVVATRVNSPRVIVGSAAFRVEVAETQAARDAGLAGRPGLRNNRGMLFVFDEPDLYGFWMKGMFFPIDIIWIADGRVAGFVEDAEPDTNTTPRLYYPPTFVRHVLEVRAGTVRESGIRIGDAVTIMLGT